MSKSKDDEDRTAENLLGIDDERYANPFKSNAYSLKPSEAADYVTEYHSSGDEPTSPFVSTENDLNACPRGSRFSRAIPRKTCCNTLPVWVVALLGKMLLVFVVLLPGLAEKIFVKSDVILVEFRLYYW